MTLNKRTSKTIELKTEQPWFDRIESGIKTYESRENDRDYQPLDMLMLKEYVFDAAGVGKYTGRSICVVVLDVWRDVPGLWPGWVHMPIAPVMPDATISLRRFEPYDLYQQMITTVLMHGGKPSQEQWAELHKLRAEAGLGNSNALRRLATGRDSRPEETK